MSAYPDPQKQLMLLIEDHPRLVLAGIALVVAGMAVVLGGEPPLILFLVPIVFVGIAASMRFPLIALAIVVAIMVSNASQNLIVEFGLPSIAKLAAPGILLLLVGRYFIAGEWPYIGWLAFALLTLVLAMKLVSSTYALNWSVSVEEAEGFMKDVIFVMLAIGLMSQKRGFEIAMNAACLTVAFICVLGIYQLVLGRDPGGFYGFSLIIENSGRFSGPLEDANFWGVMIVFSIPLALFHVLNGQSFWHTVFWAIVATFLIAGLLATNSRGGLIGFGFGLMVMALSLSLRQFLTYAFLMFIAGAVAVAFMNEETRAHFATIIGVAASAGESGDQSTEGRLASWQVAFSLFRDFPLFGVGVGNFNLHYQDRALELGLIFRGEGRSTHSLYLEFLAEQGLVGLGFVLTVLAAAATSIYNAVKALRRLGEERLARHMAAFGAGLAGYLFAMTFLQDSFPRFLWFTIALGLEARMIVAYHFERPARSAREKSAVFGQ